MFSLKNKHAVITGGGSGIGRAISLLFARQGATVHIIELNADAAAQTIEEIKNSGGGAFGYTADISKQEQVLDVFKQMNKVDILVNNAGIAHVGSLEGTTEADLDRIYNVNVKGAYNALYAAIPQ
jgi:2-keto-3-deoxy-L-fuconate dehydrogenase